MNFPLIANIVVFVVLLLRWLKPATNRSLAKKVLVGLVMGVVLALPCIPFIWF